MPYALCPMPYTQSYLIFRSKGYKLVRKYDLIAVEDLKIQELARTHWGKSILDAAWGSFMTIVEAVAVKRGVHQEVKVNPNNTSQDCSGCGVKVRKNLSLR